jgi:signal transduction histidine kinase
MRADKVNILLVDDQPAKLLTYEAILEDLGDNLIKASSGKQALELLLKTDIAVVLMDVCMPNIDGFELASLIHQHPRCRQTAIIFISAVHLTNLDQLKGYECGGVDYVSVPVVPEILRARVTVFADLYRKTRELERLNRDLEARVAERTLALERDLAERKRLEAALKEADRRKDEFLALLAHELRNPLAPIRSAIEIMGLKHLDDPELQHCRLVIERQAEHLSRLVDDLLDVSRITRGKIKLEKRPVEVATIVSRAIETNRPLLDDRRQDLRVDLYPEPLFVEGDLTRLSQVVGNLLNNAAKYTDEGGRISLCVEPTRSDGDSTSEVIIRVRDTGVGIPAELLPSVFNLFTQVDHAVDRSQGGLGIGLALVRSLVELHDGKVEAHSDGVGQGSEFVNRLPLQDHSRTTLPKEIGGEKATAIARHRILVIDDNRDSAETLAMVLRLHGSEVMTAHDGLAAVGAAERFRPDLVLLDIGMPGMDGYEVARAIRAAPWGREMLLVAQTGWGQAADRRRTQEAGFDVHMTKPVDYSKLTKLLGIRSDHELRSAEPGAYS